MDLTPWSERFSEVVAFCSTPLFCMPMGRGLARRDPAHVSPKVKLCLHTMF